MEAYGVLIHVLGIRVVEVTAHQLVDAGLWLVGVPPGSIAGCSPWLGRLVWEVPVEPEGAAILLEITVLPHRVTEGLRGVLDARVEFLLGSAKDVLAPFVRVDAVADAIQIGEGLVGLAVVEPADLLVTDLLGGALNLILALLRHRVRLLAPSNKGLRQFDRRCGSLAAQEAVRKAHIEVYSLIKLALIGYAALGYRV